MDGDWTLLSNADDSSPRLAISPPHESEDASDDSGHANTLMAQALMSPSAQLLGDANADLLSGEELKQELIQFTEEDALSEQTGVHPHYAVEPTSDLQTAPLIEFPTLLAAQSKLRQSSPAESELQGSADTIGMYVEGTNEGGEGEVDKADGSRKELLPQGRRLRRCNSFRKRVPAPPKTTEWDFDVFTSGIILVVVFVCSLFLVRSSNHHPSLVQPGAQHQETPLIATTTTATQPALHCNPDASQLSLVSDSCPRPTDAQPSLGCITDSQGVESCQRLEAVSAQTELLLSSSSSSMDLMLDSNSCVDDQHESVGCVSSKEESIGGLSVEERLQRLELESVLTQQRLAAQETKLEALEQRVSGIEDELFTTRQHYRRTALSLGDAVHEMQDLVHALGARIDGLEVWREGTTPFVFPPWGKVLDDGKSAGGGGKKEKRGSLGSKKERIDSGGSYQGPWDALHSMQDMIHEAVEGTFAAFMDGINGWALVGGEDGLSLGKKKVVKAMQKALKRGEGLEARVSDLESKVKAVQGDLKHLKETAAKQHSKKK